MVFCYLHYGLWTDFEQVFTPWVENAISDYLIVLKTNRKKVSTSRRHDSNSVNLPESLNKKINKYNELCTPEHVSKSFVGNKAKARISKRMLEKNQAHQISQKANISYPLISKTSVCVPGGKKRSFFGEFNMLCFFVTPALRSTLLPYYRRFKNVYFCQRYLKPH